MLSPSFLIMFSSSVAASVRGITVHCCGQIVGKGVILVGAFCVKLSYAPNRLSSFCRKVCSFSGSASALTASGISIASVLITNCTDFTSVFFSEIKDFTLYSSPDTDSSIPLRSLPKVSQVSLSSG